MDFDDDEIGNFGLLPPPLNNKKSKSLSRPKKSRRATTAATSSKTSVQKLCVHPPKNDMNQHPPKRNNSDYKKSCIGHSKERSALRKNNDSHEYYDSSDDDEIALSDLAKRAPPPRKMEDNGSKQSTRAVVTPAPPPSTASFFNTKQPPSSRLSKNCTKVRRNTTTDNNTTEDEGQQRRKKLKKQIGLHSFLQDKQQQSKITKTAQASLKRADNKDANKSLSLQHGVQDGRRRQNSSVSFVSASSLLVSGKNNPKEKVSGDDDASSIMLYNTNGQAVVVSSSKVASSDDSMDDEIDEFDNDVKEGGNGDVVSNDNTTSSASSNHLQRFGIHSLILGHGLPIMHPEEYYRAASAAIPSDPNTSTHTTVIQGQTNNHIHRNILSHILQRSYCPKSSTTSSSNLLTRYIHSNIDHYHHHSTETNVQLSSCSNNHNNSNNNSETCAMAFDTMGILLAMGDSHGKIDIFDFDEVYAADLKKRNEWSRHCHEYEVAAASNVWDHDDDKEDCIFSTTAIKNDDNAEKKEEEGITTGVNTIKLPPPPPPIPPTKVNPVHSFQCQFIHGNATRNNNYLNSANRPRISGIYWNPDNQDHLAVSFENKSEIHLYDVASSTVPPPCLRVGGESMGTTQQRRCEGVLSMRFISSPAKEDDKSSSSSSLGGRSGSSSSTTQIITGGAYGSVRLWSIPSTKQTGSKRRRRCCISELNAKCIWSIPVFGANGDGVSDMLILPAMSLHTSKITTTTASTTTMKPLVLLSGGSSSTLVLLDTNKCTRKAFSTSITPTVAASWNLHQLASRELAKIDSKALLPDRRWISARNMTLIEYQRLTKEGGSWWCKIGMVTNAGWVFVAELSSSNNTPRLSIHIVHHTPRIQCFNSSNERLTNLGGMALQYSLPNGPVPSSGCIRIASSNMIWLGDVKGKKYTMPSRDKYVLCEDYNTLEVLEDEVVTPGTISQSSSENGVLLVTLDKSNQYADCFPTSRNIVTRVSLPMNGSAPLALATHPGGEWMVVGCGKDDSTLLKLIRLRKVDSRM